MASTFTKDPQAVLDYEWDWSSWLPSGDTITAHTITAETGLTVASSMDTATAVVAWLSGGTVSEEYNVTCHITTAAGRQDDRTISIIMREL